MGVAFSPLGCLLVFVVCFLVSIKRIRLLSAVFFVAPFFDVEVVRFAGLTINPFYFLGMILVIKHFFVVLKLAKISVVPDYALYSLLFFLFVATMSLSLPVIMAGQVEVIPISGTFQDYDNVNLLSFTMTNISHVFKVWLLVLIYLSIVHEIKRSRLPYFLCIKPFIHGGLFVLASGVSLQLMIYFIGPHTTDIYSSIVHAVPRGDEIAARIINYNSFGAFPRMYSFAGEPSFTGNLFVFLSSYMLIYVVGYERSMMSALYAIKHRVAYFLLFLCGAIITGSTTVYLGLLVMIGVYVLFFILWRRLYPLPSLKSFNWVWFLLVLVMSFSALMLYGHVLVDYILTEHVSKIADQSGSGSIRMQSAIYGMNVFLHSPFVGVGLGSHRSASLIVALLSNVGIVGTLLFVLFVFMIIRNGIELAKRLSVDSNDRLMLSGLVYALAVWLISSFIAIPILAITFGWFWAAAAILFAATQQKQPQKTLLS